jgi:hypothetical protein
VISRLFVLGAQAVNRVPVIGLLGLTGKGTRLPFHVKNLLLKLTDGHGPNSKWWIMWESRMTDDVNGREYGKNAIRHSSMRYCGSGSMSNIGKVICPTHT